MCQHMLFTVSQKQREGGEREEHSCPAKQEGGGLNGHGQQMPHPQTQENKQPAAPRHAMSSRKPCHASQRYAFTPLRHTLPISNEKLLHTSPRSAAAAISCRHAYATPLQ